MRISCLNLTLRKPFSGTTKPLVEFGRAAARIAPAAAGVPPGPVPALVAVAPGANRAAAPAKAESALEASRRIHLEKLREEDQCCADIAIHLRNHPHLSEGLANKIERFTLGACKPAKVQAALEEARKSETAPFANRVQSATLWDAVQVCQSRIDDAIRDIEAP